MKFKDTHRLKVKERRIPHASGVEIVTPESDRTNFKSDCHKDKGQIHQEDVTIINMYGPNIRSLKS